MIDGVKLLDLSVSADALLQYPGLLFPLAIDEQTGTVLDRPRRADQQGLNFTLIPANKGDKIRCELKGSLHRYHNHGRHNADEFSVEKLLATLDELVSRFGINPFTSRLNNVEFGVNVELPFPVRRILANLISYKYRPFTKEPGDGFAYYQCYTQRYIVKLYDKGAQYRSIVPNLAPNVLRIEIKVLKMEYLSRQGIELVWLADLLDTNHYSRLGNLLISAFNEILFDEPSIDAQRLRARQRDIYQNGRNPKYWSIPEELDGRAYNRFRKGLQRMEIAFRKLIDQHRTGVDWQQQTATLISQTWNRITVADKSLLSIIRKHLACWSNRFSTEGLSEKCPKLTGFSQSCAGKQCPLLTGSAHLFTDRETPLQLAQKCPKLTGYENRKMSQINRLSIGLIWDIVGLPREAPNRARGTPLRGFGLGP